MNCSNCGAALNGRERYCPMCGQPVNGYTGESSSTDLPKIILDLAAENKRQNEQIIQILKNQNEEIKLVGQMLNTVSQYFIAKNMFK